MSEAETKTATGTCAEISERGEWTTFHIDVGSQYPLRLATKLDPLVEMGRAASKDGARFVWTYNEQESEKINEKSGKPYINRYLSGVEPDTGQAANVSPSTPAKAAASDGMTPEKWDAKERRDYRSRAWAQTLAAFQHTIKVDEDPRDAFTRLQPFQRLVYTDVCGMFAFPTDGDDIPF